VADLQCPADEGVLPTQKVADAIAKYGIDAERSPPWKV
jgi:pyruvate dehydrogenase complex dehydrogenase (E1) component